MSVSSLQEKRARKRAEVEHRKMLDIVRTPIDVVAKISVVSPKTMHHMVDLRRVIAWAHRMQIELVVHQARLEFAISDGEGAREAVLLVTMPDGVWVMSMDGTERLDRWPWKILETTVDGKIGRWEEVR